jgi:hypothetical protein
MDEDRMPTGATVGSALIIGRRADHPNPYRLG